MSETRTPYPAVYVDTIFGRGEVVSSRAMNGSVNVFFLHKDLTAEQWQALTENKGYFKDAGSFTRFIYPSQIVQEGSNENETE